MINWIYSQFEPLVQSAITNRILKFHSAMIDRGQIEPPPVAKGPKVIVCCTESDNHVADQSQYQDEPDCRRLRS